MKFPAIGFLLVTVAFAANPKDAVASDCSLALAFALDISVSVDDVDYELQRQGLASALLDPEVRHAMLSRSQSVVLMAYEWSGNHQQSVIAPWSHIEEESDLLAFAETLLEHPRVNNEYPTAIGKAIAFGVTELNAFQTCTRLVLDISGDGVSNDGFSPELAYKHFPVARLTVNGLVIAGTDPAAVDYYVKNVIHGLAAFVEIADGFEDYARAMKRKLLREIQQQRLVLR